MKLYHGTSYKYFSEILLNGITPRGKNETNWSNYPSRTDMVYFTTAYPFYFGNCADSKKSVVLEFDLMSLDLDLLYPDEDFIWSKIKQNIKDEDRERLHRLVKENLEDFRHFWADSLNNMGCGSYAGIISPEIIERACVVDWEKRSQLTCEVLEPTISIPNFTHMENHYRQMIEWFFGDISELPQVEKTKGDMEMFDESAIVKMQCKKALDYWTLQSKDRTGITVVNFAEMFRKTG